jgi:excisionase family DNA binding protein
MNKGREQDPMAWPSMGSGLETGNMASSSEPLLRPSDVARLLACSSKMVYAWAASGYLPPVRLGRLVRFKAGDVSKFVEAHAENPRTPEGSEDHSPLCSADLESAPRRVDEKLTDWRDGLPSIGLDRCKRRRLDRRRPDGGLDQLLRALWLLA